MSPTASRQSNDASTDVESSPLLGAYGSLRAVTFARSRVGARSHADGSATGTSRSSSFGIRSRRKYDTVSASSSTVERLLLVELDPLRREQRPQLGEVTLQVAERIARAHERERIVARLPEERHRQAQRRVVVGMQPQLERERIARTLVEMQAEPPRRLLHLGEAAVDPARQPPLEPGIARVLRQLRIGRRQPGEERVDRGAPADPRRVAELHARGDEPVARDLVDELRIEIGDGRLAVVVEALRADERQRARDLRERALDVVVERRAPERVPTAAAARQLRMHHPLGDRAVRELDEREQHARAVAELELGRRGGELEQLGHREQPRVDLVLQHVHRRRLARAEAAVGERLAVTRKRIRAGAPPDHFERKHDLTE